VKLVSLFPLLFAVACVGCSSADSATRPTPAPALPAVPVNPVAAESDWFEDRTPGSGVDFSYANGEEANHYTILESLGGGVALFDYDRDGRVDIFLPGGGFFEGANPPRVRGKPSKLYRNLGNWTFEDVTSAVGLDTSGFYSHGAAVGDYDCDGWPDLYVSGYRGGALFANRPADDGKRAFRNVTAEAGLPAIPWGTSAAFADLDGDGIPSCSSVSIWNGRSNFTRPAPTGRCPRTSAAHTLSARYGPSCFATPVVGHSKTSPHARAFGPAAKGSVWSSATSTTTADQTFTSPTTRPKTTCI
jgi:hypothetical protein